MLVPCTVAGAKRDVTVSTEEDYAHYSAGHATAPATVSTAAAVARPSAGYAAAEEEEDVVGPYPSHGAGDVCAEMCGS